MPTFEDAYAEWRELCAIAEDVGTTEARLAAEQARIAVVHHPAANKARGEHLQSWQAGAREGRREGTR